MLSVIIPLGPKDGFPQKLLSALGDCLPENSEIILAIAMDREISCELPPSVRIVRGNAGRAAQMNAASEQAQEKFLWFVHADSMFEAGGMELLLKALDKNPHALHYHDLVFMDDGPKMMGLNAFFVRFRSDVLKLPFGDQAFCISRSLFFELGCYDENAPYGEDHLLVWQAHHAKVPVKRIGAKVWTSARKYDAGGWAGTTLLHVSLTLKQALPEFLKLIRGKLK